MKDIQEKETAKNEYLYSLGRRREATARVRLYPTRTSVVWGEREVKKGEVFVNHVSFDTYFGSRVASMHLAELLKTANVQNRFPITVKVVGGGKKGQIDAVIHGIARALNVYDREKMRPVLKKKGYLMRDARVRERRKVGTGGKARRSKQSPKR